MALAANKVSSGPIVTHRTTLCRSPENHNFSASTRNNRIHVPIHGQLSPRYPFVERSALSNAGFWCIYGKPVSFISKKHYFLCKSTGANNTEEKEFVTTCGDVPDLTR